MRALPLTVAAGISLAALFFYSRRAAAADAPPATDAPPTNYFADWFGMTTYATTADGIANEEKYLPAITSAEQAYGLPPGLLHRQLFQESRFRSDIIEGRTVSSAGAVGIAQIIPRWHPAVDPLDPYAAISYAASLDRAYFDMFGSWSAALAAYNWGRGNQAKDLRDGILGNEWPKETRDYVAQITNDIGVS